MFCGSTTNPLGWLYGDVVVVGGVLNIVVLVTRNDDTEFAPLLAVNRNSAPAFTPIPTPTGTALVLTFGTAKIGVSLPVPSIENDEASPFPWSAINSAAPA